MNLLRTASWLCFGFISISMILSSCSGDGEPDNLEAYFERNSITPTQSASGLYYTLISPGIDPKISENNFVVFHFAQFDLENNLIGGTRNSEFPVALDISEFGPGLKEGLMLLGKGGSANLYIPPELNGGSVQSGPLIFGVEILEIYESLADYNDGEIGKYIDSEGLDPIRTEEGLYYIIEEEGEGAKPTIDATVEVNYSGYFLNGTVFDASPEDAPASFTLSNVIEGWKQGIPLFGTGGKGKLIVPSNLGYGEAGRETIPPNYPLVFDIELVEIR